MGSCCARYIYIYLHTLSIPSIYGKNHTTKFDDCFQMWTRSEFPNNGWNFKAHTSQNECRGWNHTTPILASLCCRSRWDLGNLRGLISILLNLPIQSNTGTIVSTSWSGDRANVLEVQEDWLDLSSSLAHHKCFKGVYISKFQSVIYRFETVVHTETRWPCLIFRANTWKTFLLKFFRCSLMSGKRLKLLQKQYCHKMSHVII